MRTIHNERWDKDNGNFHLVANYPLDENSNVIELGGFRGDWSRRIYDKYKSNLLVVEPIEDFCKIIQRDFEGIEKVKVEQLGISTEEKTVLLSFNGDASSQYLEQTSNQVEVKCFPIEYFMNKHNFHKVDLMQINIEGEEFYLLENWIKTDILKNFRYIQIQFHRLGSDYEERRIEIQKGLQNLGFVCSWDYPYVFESWENKNWS